MMMENNLHRIMYGIGGFCLFARCTDIWIKTLEWFQILAQLRLLNVKIPDNFAVLDQVFDFARAASLPNIFDNLEIPASIQKTPEPFYTLGIRAFFFYNAGRMLQILFVCLLAYIIFALLYFFIQWKPEFKEKLEFIFLWSLGLHVVNFTFLEVVLSMGLQICDIRYDNIYVLFGEGTAFFLLVILVAIIVCSYLVLKRRAQNLKDAKFKERFGALYSLFVITPKGFHLKIVYWIFLRKILFVIAYIALAQFNRVQVFSLFGLAFVEFLYFLITRPYEKRGILVTQVVSQVLLAGLYFLLDYLDNKDDLGVREFYQAGWILTGFAWAIGFIHMVYLIYRVITPLFLQMKGDDPRVAPLPATEVSQQQEIRQKIKRIKIEEGEQQSKVEDNKESRRSIEKVESRKQIPINKQLTQDNNSNDNVQNDNSTLDRMNTSPTKSGFLNDNTRSIHYDMEAAEGDRSQMDLLAPSKSTISRGGFYPNQFMNTDVLTKSHHHQYEEVSDIPDRDTDIYPKIPALDTSGMTHYYPNQKLQDDIPGNETDSVLLEEVARYVNPQLAPKRRRNSGLQQGYRRDLVNNRILNL